MCGSLLIALGLCHAPALPAQQIPAKPSAPQPATPPTAQLQMRVYEGFSTLGPVRGYRGTPLAVDVGMGLTKCPDGNTEINAMNIGGWLYDVPGTCASASEHGSIRVAKPQQPAPGTAVPATPPAAAPVIHCDPATWRCTSSAP